MPAKDCRAGRPRECWSRLERRRLHDRQPLDYPILDSPAPRSEPCLLPAYANWKRTDERPDDGRPILQLGVDLRLGDGNVGDVAPRPILERPHDARPEDGF